MNQNPSKLSQKDVENLERISWDCYRANYRDNSAILSLIADKIKKLLKNQAIALAGVDPRDESHFQGENNG